jgi:phosphatidylglycerol---prolipoprotein diacylglyceryl transferase
MHQTLFYIPSELWGCQVFGFGLLLALWGVVSAVTLARLVRRQGFNADTRGYVPILLVVGAVIAWVMPAILKTAPDGTLGLPIRGYGTMMLSAVVAGAMLSMWRAKRVGVDPDTIMTLIFWMIVPGIVGARAFYVIQYWSTYQEQFAGPEGSFGRGVGSIVNLTEGGLVVYGAFIGGMIGIWMFHRKHPLPFLALADLMVPAMLLGLAVGRIGCLLNGCCFGAVCEHRWAITFPAGNSPDFTPPYLAQIQRGQMYGMTLSGDPSAKPCAVRAVAADSGAGRAGLRPGDRLLRINGRDIQTVGDAHQAIAIAFVERGALHIHAENRPPIVVPAIEPPARSLPVEPTQPLSTIDAGLLCLLLLVYEPFRRRDGELLALTVAIYPVTRLLIEMLRTDEAAKFGTSMSIGQCVSVLLLACDVALWFYILRRPRGLALSPRPAQGTVKQEMS